MTYQILMKQLINRLKPLIYNIEILSWTRLINTPLDYQVKWVKYCVLTVNFLTSLGEETPVSFNLKLHLCAPDIICLFLISIFFLDLTAVVENCFHHRFAKLSSTKAPESNDTLWRKIWYCALCSYIGPKTYDILAACFQPVV